MIFFLFIWSLCCLGFFALASSMDKHQKQIYGQLLDASKTRLATFAGWALLILALIICMSQGSLSNMISYWIGVLSFSALFIGLCMSYYAEKLKKIALAISAISIISLILHLI